MSWKNTLRAAALGLGCSAALAQDVAVATGTVSWYGRELAGRKTASGDIFDPAALTMAHRTWPLGTQVKVTNLRNQRSVVVTVNDRGPYTPGRIADLSEAAARQIGMVRSGVTQARLEVLDTSPSPSPDKI
jgi:rare lipoprotein A